MEKTIKFAQFCRDIECNEATIRKIAARLNIRREHRPEFGSGRGAKQATYISADDAELIKMAIAEGKVVKFKKRRKAIKRKFSPTPAEAIKKKLELSTNVAPDQEYKALCRRLLRIMTQLDIEEIVLADGKAEVSLVKRTQEIIEP